MEESQHVVAPQKLPKSPPLAFQTTSNDALWAPMGNSSNIAFLTSPPVSQLFDSHVSESELEMQTQIDKQTEALRLQHQAFVAERESWQLEKDRLYRRITSLESLLKGTASGHSPARSPVISPHSGSVCSPSSIRGATPLGLSRLASIAEVETSNPRLENRRPPPSLMRESAPKCIDLSSISVTAATDVAEGADVADVVTSNDADLRVDGPRSDLDDEVPRSPPQSRAILSPPPLKNRHLAGHTPLRGSFSGPLSPALSSFSERLDTPTRSNTTLNETVGAESPDDRPLKGPLMMPELPNQPGEENFTMSMLEAKLRDMVEHPEESEPVVLKSPSPGLAEVSKEDDMEEKPVDCTDKPTDQPASGESKLTSPQATQKTDAFDGSIKLRKKPSCNFGAPLGQMHPMWKH